MSVIFLYCIYILLLAIVVSTLFFFPASAPVNPPTTPSLANTSVNHSPALFW